MFLTLHFFPAWLQCSNGSDAAINDRQFNLQMLDCEAIDAPVAEATTKKLSNCCYKEEESVVFAILILHSRESDVSRCFGR